jgi:hypothetical protein
MFKYLKSKKVNERGAIGIGICTISLILGYIILNHISLMEGLPLGNTIYIIIGSTLLFSSIIGILIILKYMYDFKIKQAKKERRKQQYKLYYLKKTDQVKEPN